MKRSKPTIFISFGLVSLTLALTLTAHLLGLLPDGYRAELDSRAKVAESLAVQLASAVNKNDTTTLQETMRSVVLRNDDVNSTAFRAANGNIVFSAGDHALHWVPNEDGKSTPTHVSVPMLGENGTQGAIEISFGPPSAGARYFGIPASLFVFLALIATAGFTGYYIILRRSLKELDPGRVIPERVQRAFDTLSEGVIILDEKERILLVNQSFAEMYELEDQSLHGTKISTLSWRMVDGRAVAGGYPWHTALREERETREAALSLRTPSGIIHNFNINSTVIGNDDGKCIGAIVTLRDMTRERLTNDDLAKTLKRLEETEEQITQQNRELTYLNTHDAESGCLNRKTFFQRFLKDAEKTGQSIAVLMVGIDHFRALNDRLGPIQGDKAIVDLANTLRVMAVDPSYVGRYNEKEFCVALPESGDNKAAALAEALRTTAAHNLTKIMPVGEKPTISVGVAIRTHETCSAHELVHRASRSLKAAKSTGTSQIQNWDGLSLKQSASHGASTLEKLPASALHPTESLPEPVNQFSDDETIQAAAARTHASFVERIDATIERSARDNKVMAVLHLSIASWDYLLEALGEPLCELLMRALKRQIETTLRDQDHILVLGPTGELLISIESVDHEEDVRWMIERLLDAAGKAIQLPEDKVYASCRVGAALYPQCGQTGETLLKHAAIAKRRACQDKPLEGYLIYNDSMVKTSKSRLEIETGIREALEFNEFQLSFQPIVDAKTGRLTAAEALLRCENSRLKKVRMDHVIDTAEKSSLIAEVDKWVIRNALNQMQAWCEAGLQLPKVSINISAKQLTNIAFMDEVYNMIKSVRFSPSRVQLEVTETAKMADVEVAAPQLKRMQNLGVHIALDDFGTGQASLTYLQRLHPDVIKIDRSFINGVNTNHANATMVSAMTVMAHCLGLKVVVEGVEDEEQLIFLRDTHCDEIQGYFISKPMPAKIMTEWLGVFVPKNGAADHVRDLQTSSQSSQAEAA